MPARRYDISWLSQGLRSEKCAVCHSRFVSDEIKATAACAQCPEELQPPKAAGTLWGRPAGEGEPLSIEQLIGYGCRYPDLAPFGSNVAALREHWQNYGKAEGRRMPSRSSLRAECHNKQVAVRTAPLPRGSAARLAARLGAGLGGKGLKGPYGSR